MPIWFEKFEILKKKQIELNNDNSAQLHERLVNKKICYKLSLFHKLFYFYIFFFID